MYTLIQDLNGQPRIRRDADGATIPADPANRDFAAYQAWLAAGNTPASPPAAGPTAEDVRAEARRRIRIALGADSDAAAMLTQVKALERVSSLHDRRISGETLAAQDLAFLEIARTKRADLEAIRAASNAMEGSPPADYASAARWP